MQSRPRPDAGNPCGLDQRSTPGLVFHEGVIFFGYNGGLPDLKSTVTEGWRPLVARSAILVGLAVLLAGFLAVVGSTIVGRHGGGVLQNWDESVGHWFLHHRTGLVGIAKAIAFLGDAPILGAIATVITLILLALGQRARALVPLAAYLGGELLVYMTRVYVHRPRPITANYPAPGSIPGIHETSFSFPSGHATAGSAVVISLAGLAAITWKVWWPWIVGGLLVGTVAGSRLVLGVHWFSDVTFGMVVGVIWGVAAVYVLADPPWPWRSHLTTGLQAEPPAKSASACPE